MELDAPSELWRAGFRAFFSLGLRLWLRRSSMDSDDPFALRRDGLLAFWPGDFTDAFGSPQSAPLGQGCALPFASRLASSFVRFVSDVLVSRVDSATRSGGPASSRRASAGSRPLASRLGARSRTGARAVSAAAVVSFPSREFSGARCAESFASAK